MKRKILLVAVTSISMFSTLFTTRNVLAASAKYPPEQSLAMNDKINNTSAASLKYQEEQSLIINNKIKLNPKQLIARDSDIDTWMPNKSVQASVLTNLMFYGYLPFTATVDQVTKELLASVDSSKAIAIGVNTFKGGEITNNISEGLQYFNPEAYVYIVIRDSSESKLVNLDFQQLHQNVDGWYLLVYTPQKLDDSLIMKKIKETQLPKKDQFTNGSVGYYQGTYNKDNILVPTITKTIDISQNLSPTITLSETDFWNKIDKTSYVGPGFADEVHVSNTENIVLRSLFNYEPISDTEFLGTFSPTDINKHYMNLVNVNPSGFYAAFSSMYFYNIDDPNTLITLTNNIYANFVK